MASNPVRVGGLLYHAPSKQKVHVKLFQYAGIPIKNALARIRIAGATAEWWEAQLGRGGVSVERRDSHGSVASLDKVDAEYIVGGNDVAILPVHVHERVIRDVALDILYEDDDVLAVVKPANVEICKNPSGGAIRSSLVGMLEELGYTGVAPVHRIDKPVSGVVCCAKHKKANSRLTRCVQNHDIKKLYLARVFAPNGPPPEGLCIEAPLRTTTEEAKTCVDTAGKLATTFVRQTLRHFQDQTAVVAVEPITGRMHQIRCHLAHAGYPIANDSKYAGSRGVGENSHVGKAIYVDNEVGELRAMTREHFEPGCETCVFITRVLDGLVPEPRLLDGIWLHSWIYEFPKLGLKFEAPLPQWAL